MIIIHINYLLCSFGMAKDKSMDWSVRRCNVERIISFEHALKNIKTGELDKLNRFGFDLSTYVTEDIEDFVEVMNDYPDLFKRVKRIYNDFRFIYWHNTQSHINLRLWVTGIRLKDSDVDAIIKTEGCYLSRIAGNLIEVGDALNKVSYNKK